jgi:hypothetical protein
MKELKKREIKSRYNFEKETCEYESGTWCNLPKYKRCKDCIRCTNGDKACMVTAF